jgi:hypothetical protein
MSKFLRLTCLAILGLVGCKPLQNANVSRDLSFVGPAGTPRITLAYIKSSKLADDVVAPTAGVCEGTNGYTDCKQEPLHVIGFCAYEEDVRVKANVLKTEREKRQNPSTFKVQNVDVTYTRYAYKSLHALAIDEAAMLDARNLVYKTLGDKDHDSGAVERILKRFENVDTTISTDKQRQQLKESGDNSRREFAAFKTSASEYAATLSLIKNLIAPRKYLLPEACAKTITQDEAVLQWL